MKVQQNAGATFAPGTWQPNSWQGRDVGNEDTKAKEETGGEDVAAGKFWYLEFSNHCN